MPMNNTVLCWSINLTHQILKLEYFGETRSIPLLLILWLLALSSHQQSCYCLCNIYRPFTPMRKDFKYLHHRSIDTKYKLTYILTQKNSARVNIVTYVRCPDGSTSGTLSLSVSMDMLSDDNHFYIHVDTFCITGPLWGESTGHR